VSVDLAIVKAIIAAHLVQCTTRLIVRLIGKKSLPDGVVALQAEPLRNGAVLSCSLGQTELLKS